MPEKVKLKNGRGEFVYPVIDPNDAGGGAGGRALALTVTDNGGGQQSIQCLDLLNVTESHGEQIPTEITAEEFCQAFTLGGSINLFINIIHDPGTDYQSGIAFTSKWSSGDENTSIPFITGIMDQDVQAIVDGINNIEWHGICKGLNDNSEQTFQDIPAICHVNLSINIDDEIQFNEVSFFADSLYNTRNSPITINLWTDDLILAWYDYNSDYQFLANRCSSVEEDNEVYVDPFWGWTHGENSVIVDLFSEGNNTLVAYDSDTDTVLRFRFSSEDPEVENDERRFIFSGIDCNKTLIITESRTNEDDDPRGQDWSYPYISNYEIRDNGGGSGNDDLNWINVPVYDSDIKRNPFAKTRSYAILRVPIDPSSGDPSYDTVGELLSATHEQNINVLFGVREGVAQVIGVAFSNEENSEPRGTIYSIVDGGSAQVITASTPLDDLVEALGMDARFYREIGEE